MSATDQRPIIQPALPTLSLPAPARIGEPAASIDTPSLVLDLDAFERNLDRMQQVADKAGVALRPHAKAHKCPDVSRAQVARGAVGVCCQKVSEALPFVRAGITDIHISNQVAGPAKAAMLAELARHARLSVCVDDAAQIDTLAAATQAAGTRLDVLVELDVGQHRCGVPDADGVLRLVERLGRRDTLTFRGLQAYHGGIQHVRQFASRREAAAHAAECAGAAVARLAAAGVACDIVTGGGTGSVAFDLASGVYTEIQPGSYVFMDADYGSLDGDGAVRGEGSGLGFEHSLLIATTVMSRAVAEQAVLDAGLKSMAVDSGLPWIWQDGARSTRLAYVAANDEHGLVQPLGGAVDALPPLGARVMLVPGHCDPTLNLYDELVGIRAGVVECLWPVSARGHSR
ncbi:DSD1 family PLP-dependent enzyme [Cupriavidus respiraculi]|uniref:D-threonine aldolase n=1 Tax=Cupriavidus respiraculi TaxID=195930 RepID=A0ABM8WDU1_9BURK|nr:DSD1 family PLP-dependent enzyme [Cupriavidus respiraculi]CAG9165401.1 D-threonine aldolase [Cupriavidus respiraculi]